MPRHGEVRAVLPATPHQVWDVLSDVTRIGEWSHECRGADWLGGASRAAVGARFSGRSRSGIMSWSRTCTVTELTVDRTFAYVTHGVLLRDSTAWTTRIEPDPEGALVIQSYDVVSLPRWAEIIILAVVPNHGDRVEALEGDLRRLGRVAADGAPSSPPAADLSGPRTPSRPPEHRGP
jgi:hypothetical protein